MLNWYESDEFSLVNMTEAINTLQVVPSRIGSMNLFQGGGMTTTTVTIEEKDQTLHLIPAAPRGTMPEYGKQTERKLRAVPVPHLPKNDTVMADASQNVRAFGTDDALESVAGVVNDKLLELRQEHELTHEWHRIGALQGEVKDADGTSTLINWFTIFGVTRLVVNWDTSKGTGLKEAAIAARRATESALKLIPYSRVHAMCSEGFWDKIQTSSETRDAYNRWNENVFARESNNQPFTYSQIDFEEMRGKVGATPLVPANEAFSFPTGANIYRRRFAPAPFEETVNTVGLPLYAKQERMEFGVGRKLHTNSNPIFWCNKPKVLIRWTFS